MTKQSSSPTVRETSVTHCGRPIVAELHTSAIVLKIKGKRGSYAIPYIKLLALLRTNPELYRLEEDEVGEVAAEEKCKKALAAAVAAIYLADSSDYGSTLWDIIKWIEPKATELLVKNEQKAYEKYVENNL